MAAPEVERLYEVFARYPLGPLQGCPCCSGPADHGALRRAPLRELGADDLDRFAFKAMTTLGGVDDYRHVLPRLLELVEARAGGLGFAPWLVGQKLAYGRVLEWPEDEQEALQAWALATLDRDLAAPPAAFTAPASVELARAAGLPLGPLLARLWPARPPYGLLHLASLASHGDRAAAPGAADLDAWLADGAKLVALEEGALAALAADALEEALELEEGGRELLRRLQGAPPPPHETAPAATLRVPPSAPARTGAARAAPVAVLEVTFAGVARAPERHELHAGRRFEVGRARTHDLYVPELRAGTLSCVIDADARRGVLTGQSHVGELRVNGELLRLGHTRPLADGDVVETAAAGVSVRLVVRRP